MKVTVSLSNPRVVKGNILIDDTSLSFVAIYAATGSVLGKSGFLELSGSAWR